MAEMVTVLRQSKLKVARVQESCYITIEEYQKLRTLAQETGRSVSMTLADIVTEFFEDEGDDESTIH